ncbi:hypothetical protein [Listeria grandensis]|nr:hypothetical protein [Listeria grandensis]
MPKSYTKEFKETVLALYKQGKSARELLQTYNANMSIPIVTFVWQ